MENTRDVVRDLNSQIPEINAMLSKIRQNKKSYHKTAPNKVMSYWKRLL